MAQAQTAGVTLRQAIGDSSFFSDNARWKGALAAVMAVPASDNLYEPAQDALRSQAVASRLVTPTLAPTSTLSDQSSPHESPSSAFPLEAYKANPPLTLRRLLRVYSQLSKSRLTNFQVLVAMSGVAICPLPTTVPVLLSTALGTFLCSAGANTFNQISEIPFDAQMARTRNRPLVRRAISPAHAASFAVLSSLSGVGILWTCVNPTTAALGAFTIALYAGIYTPLKRMSVANTWVGAVVGAIPPLMGWTACGGHLLPSASHPIQTFLPSFLTDVASYVPMGDNPLAAFALAMLLFSWQFPHFCGLSHVVRSSYAQAGYRMLSVVSPQHNTLVSLRHAILLIPICSVLVPISGLTSWWFALTSLAPNLICVVAAWRWRTVVLSGMPSEAGARKVFMSSLWYLPVMLGLMMLHKKDSWWSQWIEGSAETDGKDVQSA